MFEIVYNRGYYEIYHGSKLISTADTYHEAELDIEKYENQIEEYVNTGSLPDWRAAIFL